MDARTEILPERIADHRGLLLRRWLVADVEVLAQAVAESAEHLRPWMGWIDQEPLSLPARRSMLGRSEREWRQGGDVMLGIFFNGRVVGGAGLHRRIAPDGLELGYWTHPRFIRQGMATASARLLTDAAFRLPSITHVEIHHDKANLASMGVPKKLGFRIIAELPDEPAAPAEIGIEVRWRMDRALWIASQDPSPA